MGNNDFNRLIIINSFISYFKFNNWKICFKITTQCKNYLTTQYIRIILFKKINIINKNSFLVI